MNQTRSTSSKRTVRYLAIFALILIGVGAAFTGLASFMKSNSPLTTGEVTAESTADLQPTIPTLGFLYIDKNTVTLDEEQAIAVAFDDDTTPLAATINLTQTSTGRVQTYEAAKTEDHAALFTFPVSTLDEGNWDVTSIDGDNGESVFTVAVDKNAGEGPTGFRVVTTTTKPAPEATPTPDETPQTPTPQTTPTTPETADQPPLVTTMYVASDEELVSAETFDEALQAAEVTLPATGANELSPASSGVLKVALDPGHGAGDSGAIAVNGAYEKDFNWKISNACKAELSQYRGVEIFLTRSENECPSIKERVDRAVAWGADVIISQHNNSVDSPSPRGAQVYIPNESAYNHYTHTEGAKLGNAIQAELVKLGLQDRGGNLTRGAINAYYSDGMIQDYYGITRYARLAGITGIIVEHAFVSNPQDFEQFLSSDAKLAALGVADATGIAKCYGLSKTPTISWNPSVSAQVNNDYMTATITIGAGAPANVSAVSAVVKRGDFTKSYTTQRQGDGRWTVMLPLSDLGSVGTYTVEAHATYDGQDAIVGQAGLTVNTTVSAALQVTSINTTTGTISVEVNASSPVGIADVRLPVWCESVNGQDDLQWYTMTPNQVDQNGNGTYRLTVSALDHKMQSGTYHLDLYVTEKNGIFNGVVSTPAELTLPKVWLSVERSGDGKTINVSAWGGLLSSSTPVRFPTWSEAGGQDDLHWYESAYDARTRSWKQTIRLADHGDTGMFRIHCYADLKGELVMLADDVFSISAARGTVEVTSADAATGQVTVKANVYGDRGVSSVAVEAWCDSTGGQDDRTTHPMYGASVDSAGNGIYSTTFNLSDHAGQQGRYQFDLMVVDGVGISSCVDSATVTIGQTQTPDPGPSTDPDPNPGTSTDPEPTPPAIGDDYEIMGATTTTVDQMVRFYQSSGETYPADVYASKGAPTVRDFCQIAYDEARAEGVRAEVLIVQVALETGWLQFHGDVSPDQCNFGGIGATGGGEPGNVFPDVRTGLRAQVQHLKAYASTAPLNQGKVDPRFDYVSRGCAPTVRGLEGHWAMGQGYGDKLLRLLNQLFNA